LVSMIMVLVSVSAAVMSLIKRQSLLSSAVISVSLNIGG